MQLGESSIYLIRSPSHKRLLCSYPWMQKRHSTGCTGDSWKLYSLNLEPQAGFNLQYSHYTQTPQLECWLMEPCLNLLWSPMATAKDARLFCTVPIPIHHSFLTSIQKKITRYIRDTKPPRCAHHILTRHQKRGGVSLPHIQTYYYASILDQLYYWWHPTPNKTWSIMESAYQSNKLHDILLLTFAGLSPNTITAFPPITASLAAWKKFTQTTSIAHPSNTLQIPLKAPTIHL